ncbi:transcription factor Bye1p [[Candida] railenensis]|uniref:Transcription factor BYE1 n=1 Tax=[Candida] railenensis TaxID=45579 RepID=A0A9P0QKD2_9ASCO|nr:transcription factor Bye1p [[Candida] railenensis]
MSERRSARSNKGKHSQREFEEDVFYSGAAKRELNEGTGVAETNTKKQKVGSNAAGVKKEEDDEDEGEVLCTPCGANKDNYDEETDQGGTMIECDECKTWQHAKCMGYMTKKAIPKDYKCNLCEPRDLPQVPESKVVEKVPINAATAHASSPTSVVIPPSSFYPVTPTYSLDNLKDKTRKSVAKAFLNVFQRNLPSDSEDQTLPIKMALELESEINLFSPRQGQERKYTDRSRSLVVLIKKPNVMNRIISKELTFKDIVNSSPEEIDDELKKYAEKVRSESIRRSVLTIDDASSQRIRRTHKGEEIVENVEGEKDDNSRNEEMIISKNVDHRRFEEKEPSREIEESSKQQHLVNNIQYDDSDVEVDNRREGEEEGTDNIPDLDDDDLDFILKDKKVEEEPVKKFPLPTAKQPSVTTFWNGRITFPEFVTFVTKASFISAISSNSAGSSPVPSSVYQRQLKVIKEVFSKPAYEIEGKLDKTRADQYLSKIVSTRDLFLVKLHCEDSDEAEGFNKLKDYLFENNKVGVLSGKPHFVKDSYILSLKEGNIPEYFKKDDIGEGGLFAVFVVKKDYIPSNRSILKRAVPTSNFTESYNTPKAKVDTSSLDSILSKLDADDEYTPSLEGRYSNENVNRNNSNNNSNNNNNIASSLTTEQLQFLSGIVQQNPHVQNNPDQLIQLLQEQNH